jgi:hypothetical protein
MTADESHLVNKAERSSSPFLPFFHACPEAMQ